MIFKQERERDISTLTPLALLRGVQVCPLEVSVGCLTSRSTAGATHELVGASKRPAVRQALTVTPLGLMLGVKDI